jgi:hypothetical protein
MIKRNDIAFVDWRNVLTVRFCAGAAAALVLLGLAPTATAGDDHSSGSTVYHHIGTVTEPAVSAIQAGMTPTNPTGRFASFDISWVDSARDVYYLADRSNNAVDVIDTTDGSFVMFLGHGAFAGVIAAPPFPPGPNRSGPNGVVTDDDGNVWVGDGLINGVGHSSLKAFNPTTGVMIANIDNGGAGRADELAFGRTGGGRILIANPNEPTTAFVTLVNTQTKMILRQVRYDAPANAAGVPPAGHGFNTFFGTPTPSQHGLEQPAFLNGKFYLNVPATVQNTGGELDVSDPNTGVITAVLPLATCGGTGLAALPHNELLVECGDSARILDAHGNELVRFPEFGASDQIWFNPGDGRAYFALPPNATLRPGIPAGLGALDVANRRSLGITPAAGAQGLHSIAADAHNNRIFIPSSDNPDNGGGGIAMMHAAPQRHESDD